MAYFKDKSNNVFWFDDEQIEDGLSKEMIEITEEEKDAIVESNIPQPTIQDQIDQEKAYLSSTDWIVTKISDYQIRGNDISPLLVKYESELTERENARVAINNLELQL